MFCVRCGKALAPGAQFCGVCGAPVPEADKRAVMAPPGSIGGDAARQTPGPGERVSENIVRGADGKYRWVYELNLLRSPVIFLLVWKIFFFIVLGIFAFLLILDMADWGTVNLLTDLKMLGYFLLGMTALVGIGYLVYAAVMGGKYCVLFEMDDAGICHRQMPRQAEKAQLISGLTVLAGLAGGRVSTVGAGLNSARTEMYTAFARVRKLKVSPRRNLIRTAEGLEHNQIYADPVDFPFVEQFIRQRCVNVK